MAFVSLNLLPEGFKDIQVWRDFSSAIDSVFGPEVGGAINALAGLKTLEEIAQPAGSPAANPYIGRSTLLLLNNIFGIRALETDLLTNTDLVNFIQFGPQFFKEKGSANFLNFLSFSINALLQQTFLWTEDYINFYPQSALNLGYSSQVSGVSLGTANGSTTTFTMTDPGDPDSFYNPKAVPVAYAGVYKQDWQGNQLQYSTPRTNLLTNSNNFNAASWTNTNCTITAAATTGPDGTTSGTKLAVANVSNPNIQNNDYTVPSSAPANISASVWLKAGNITQAVLNSFQNGVGGVNANATILSGPGSVSNGGGGLLTVTGLSATQWTRVGFTTTGTITSGSQFNLYIKPQTATPTVGDYVYCAFSQMELGTVDTSYIATSGSTVTVTDYSLVGSQLTFSTAPLSNATLTWQDASSNIFNFGIGNGSTTVYNLGVEYNPGPSIYKSDWQGNQLQYATPRTNLISNGNTPGGTGWSTSSGGTGTAPIVTLNYATGPDGTTGAATRLQANQGSGSTTNDYSILQPPSFTAVNGTKYIHSVWLKSNTGSNQTVYMAQSGAGPIGVTVTPTWSRFGDPYTATSNGTLFPHIGTRGTFCPANNSLDILVAYEMVEAAQSGLTTPTSYIPTTTAPVTVTDYTLAGNQVTFALAPASGSILTFNGLFEFLPIWQPGGTWYPTTQVSIQYDYSKFSQSVATNFSAQQAVVDFYYAIAPINLVINQFLVTLTSKASGYSNVSVVASIRIYSGNT